MPPKLGLSALFDKLNEWIFCSDSLTAKMEGFAKERCHLFPYEPDNDRFEAVENKLEYTQLHKEFQTLFEAELNAFLAEAGWSGDAFLAAVTTELAKKDCNEELRVAYHMLTALTDYSTFKIMMLETRQRSE